MYLKSLTIKGFKSFADTANLSLEPGITVVVGPNGSGKSNVVDAIAWVLGAQKPSAVRSQKMDDVIFAGTATKAALGRAEVALTIDNSDGVLPIDFTEVTITRTLFRTGESDYAINGVSCRLLDIQDLLSDSGVGRQQHIIVSQGQIDAVLNARPEDRRSIIEEAAGILKYRKRKERAERRLSATEDNLHRISDLVREVRRQLKPLEKQANAARRHGDLITELTALKTHLVGRELKSLTGELESAHRRRLEFNERERVLKTSLATLDSQVLDAEAELGALGGSDVGDVLSMAQRLAERIKGQKNVVGERQRRLERELQTAVDQGVVASLEAEAARIAADLAAATEEVEGFAPAFAALAEAEEAFGSEQVLLSAEADDSELGPAPAEAAEVRAQLKALESAAQRDEHDAKRLADQLDVLTNRAAKLAATREEALATIERVQPQIPDLEARAAAAAERREACEAAVQQGNERRREADGEANRWKATADALSQALDDARSRAGADSLAGSAGVLGTLLDLVAVDAGWETAVEAAAGEALQAVVVDSAANGKAALEALSRRQLTGAVLALGAKRAVGGRPSVGEPVRSHVRAVRPDVEPMLDALFATAVVIDGDWRAAVDVALQHPDAIVVTSSGDRFGPGGWRIGQAGSGATGAALDEALEKAESAAVIAMSVSDEYDAANTGLAEARTSRRSLEDQLRVAQSELEKAIANAERSAVEHTTLSSDRDRLDQQLSEVAERRQAEQSRLDQLQNQLPGLIADEEAHLEKVRQAANLRNQLNQRTAALAARRSDLEVKSAAIAERSETLTRRQVEVEARLERLVVERAAAKVKREEVERSLEVVGGLAARLASKSDELAAATEILRAEQAAQSEASRQVSGMLSTKRKERQSAEHELVDVRERANRLELNEAENRIRLETLTEAVRNELDTEPEIAMQAPLPELPDGASAESRVRELERELKLLGPINPLALEEFEQLKERHEFLSTQLEDVKSTRKELRKLIREVDDEIVNVFAAAYADVATNFVDLFETLFPGGKGAVTLTNGDDLLNCGIEIEAKPSGKNVKKLSLLSGGERTLTALGFLFAVFRSRPSPFYVMDEVEAALDDMNLHRFLSLVNEFRKDAQLVIVSHQKRTMEAADVLYGVSMKPGGSSKVVSEKVDSKKMESVSN